MAGNIKDTSPSTSVPDSIFHGWVTVDNQTTHPSFSFPSESKVGSDPDGPSVEHIEGISNYPGDGDDEEEHAVISGPLAEHRVSEAITTIPTAAAAAVASEAVTENTEAEVEDYDCDTDAYATLHFRESEAASGYRGSAAGKRPGAEEGEHTETGLTAGKVFEARLKRIQEMMGMHEARWKKKYDVEQDKKEDDYWNKYMVSSSSSAFEPDSPGIEDSGAPARRQQYIQVRQNHLKTLHDGKASGSTSTTSSTPSLPTPSPPRQNRQSSRASNADISLPILSPSRPMRENSVREASSSATGVTIPLCSPSRLKHGRSTRDARVKIGVDVSIPFTSPISSAARRNTSNSEAYGKALVSFDALCQSFDDYVQLQERENMNATSNEASSFNDVNVNINININNNCHHNGSGNATDVNGTETKNDNDFPCDSTRNNESDQEYDADGESSDPLALDAMIPRERANVSPPELEADSGYEEGN